MSRILPLILVSAAIAAGCASQETGESGAAAGQRSPAAEPAAMAEAPAAEAALATVTGTMGCGQCMFKTTSECSAALQTDEGVVFILEDVGKDSPLFADRMEGGVVQVTGARRAEGGTHYLAVQSFEMVDSEDEDGGEEG